jgi:hypothetical protein
MVAALATALGFAGAAAGAPAAGGEWAPVGELLTYRVEAMGMEAGLVRVGVTERFDLGDRVVATLAGEAHARGVYTAWHHLPDEVLSRIDLGARVPVQTVTRWGEPGHRWDVHMEYPAATAGRTAVSVFPEGKAPRSWAFRWRDGTQDVLSAIYAARGRAWAIGDRMSAPVYVGWDLFAVEMHAARREWIATAWGPQSAIALEVTAVATPDTRIAVPGAKPKLAAKPPGSAKLATAVAAAASARPATAAPASAKPAAPAKPKPPTIYKVTVWLTDDAGHVPLEARASYEGIPLRALLVDRAVPSS